MEKPLVTISIITYNQEKYVREAVRGLLSQTYEPLEIVISDDHSTDRTWDIIVDEVELYKKAGGIHANIVLNRNVENLGLVKHLQFARTLNHGELWVIQGGDDISLPVRVERTVEEWVKGGRRAKLIHVGGWKIDMDGNKMRWPIEPLSAFHPRGALAAYTPDVFASFPDVEMAYEDRMYAGRAIILGEELYIDEKLVLYRVGSGMSTKKDDFRKNIIQSCKNSIAGVRLNLEEFEKYKDRMTSQKHSECVRRASAELNQLERWLRLYSGKTFLERWSGRTKYGRRWLLRTIFGNFGCAIGPIRELLCFLPKWIGTPLLNWYEMYVYKHGYA